MYCLLEKYRIKSRAIAFDFILNYGIKKKLKSFSSGICYYTNNNINTMNCYCQPHFDLRCVCYPIADYRRLRKDERGLKYDFRKCPMRFETCIQFIMNDYELYKTIEAEPTEIKRIAILKKIITKKFKLSKQDFEIILNDYITQYDNLINNLEEFETEEYEEERLIYLK